MKKKSTRIEGVSVLADRNGFPSTFCRYISSSKGESVRESNLDALSKFKFTLSLANTEQVILRSQVTNVPNFAIFDHRILAT